MARRLDDFTMRVKRPLAARVGFRCSNPACDCITAGPDTDPSRAINLGEAAHITAASDAGPRFDRSLASKQRRSIENAIWLCGKCAKLIDSDEKQFPVELLKCWKIDAEDKASRAIGATSKYRPLAANEVMNEIELEYAAGLAAMKHKFGCHIEWNPYIEKEPGHWMRFDGALVRGDDLIAIEIHKVFQHGVRYYAIEHLLDSLSRTKFQRFLNCAVYFVLISEQPRKVDKEAASKVTEIVERFPVEAYVCPLRLNELRAEYGL